MAKQRSTPAARKPRNGADRDDSLLLQSAESLGRVIGELQRQIDNATKRLSKTTRDAVARLPRTSSGRATDSTARKAAPKRKTQKAKSARSSARKRGTANATRTR
jgi:hypothetical protein